MYLFRRDDGEWVARTRGDHEEGCGPTPLDATWALARRLEDDLEEYRR